MISKQAALSPEIVGAMNREDDNQKSFGLVTLSRGGEDFDKTEHSLMHTGSVEQ